MIPIVTTWLVSLDGEERRVESAYNPLTGGMTLKLDGAEIHRWPGGIVEGSRLAATRDFEIAGRPAAFEAGLTKFNRYFRLRVEGKLVEPLPLPWSREVAVFVVAALFVGGIAGLAMLFGGPK